ncbi:unnamed protein product, partial [Meganyctiphanes norvegica]
SVVPLVIKMKVVLAILAFAATAQAAPAAIFGKAHIPIDAGYPYTDALGFSVPKGLPHTTYNLADVAPAFTYSHIPAFAPLTYAVAPAVAPGYVAQTLGATHIAPLPAGIGYASHHINLAAAPGTETE